MSSSLVRRGRAAGSGLRRRVDTRQQKQVLLLVTTGDSEKNYFLELKARLADKLKANVVVRNTGSEMTAHKAIALAKKWDAERAASPNKDRFDQIWLVLDREPHEDQAWLRPELEKLLKQSGPQKRRWHVAGTNPCLEYWYLLHFQDYRSSFETSGRCVNALKKLNPEYRKPMVPKEVLDSKAIQTALERARVWAEASETADHTSLHPELRFLVRNPSTGMYLLISEFLDLGR